MLLLSALLAAAAPVHDPSAGMPMLERENPAAQPMEAFSPDEEGLSRTLAIVALAGVVLLFGSYFVTRR